MLESGCNKLACCLRRMDVPDTSLRVTLQFGQRSAHALPVGQPYSVVAADKRRDRYRLRCGERGIPSGAVFDARDFFSVLAFVGSGHLMPNELCLGNRVLPLAQSSEVFALNGTIKIPLPGELALPFAVALLVAAPIVLLLRGKLFRVVVTSLAGRQRL